MTLSTTGRRVQYDGNDATVAFSFPYKFVDEDDLVVVLTDEDSVDTVQTITTHYTVAGEGAANGGTVTMVAAPATGETLTIYREVELKQETDLSNQGAFFLESLEDSLDNLTSMVQQLNEVLDRCVKSDIVSGETSLTTDGIETYIDTEVGEQVDIALNDFDYEISIHEETAIASQDTITTSFTLAGTTDNIYVYIDGVKLRKSDISRTSDNVITLESALSGGEEIEVVNGALGPELAELALKARTLVATDGTTELFDPMTNDQYLLQRNAADSAFINLIKVNASDQVEIGVAVKLNGNIDINGNSIVDGGTTLAATLAELNTIADGILATAAEVNAVCDGATATAAELNAAADGIGVTIPRQKVIEIGTWNMDLTSSVQVNHGLTISSIVGCRWLIRSDNDSVSVPNTHSSTTDTLPDIRCQIYPTYVELARRGGGSFDDPLFNSTGINRGWVIVDYID